MAIKTSNVLKGWNNVKISRVFHKQMIFAAFLNLLIILNVSVVIAQDDEVSIEQVVEAANQALPGILDLIPVGREEDYGFKDRKEFEIATTGIPLLVYTFSNDFLGNSEFNEEESLLFTNQWRVPVIVNGGHKALLTVEYYDGKLKVVDFGAGVLAKELGSFKIVKSSANRRILLRCYKKKCDFFISKDRSKKMSESKIRPLHSAKQLIKRKRKSSEDSYTLKEIREFTKD